MSNNNQECINSFFEFYYGGKEELPEYICHYTSKEIISKIFKQDALSFKLTNIHYFKDKLEGKCGNVFYDIALEELMNEKQITLDERVLLEEMKMAKPGFLFTSNADPNACYKSSRAITYVGCFSKEYNDPFMIKNYIKNEKHEGICIKLSGRFLQDSINYQGQYGFKAGLYPVLYGREVVEYFKKRLIELIKITDGVYSDKFNLYGRPWIRQELLKMSFIAKSGRFWREKEYRLIIQVPVNIPKGCDKYVFEKKENGILFKIERSQLIGFDFVNLSSSELDDAKKIMKQNYYTSYLL